jgi:histone-lysine N-methyltransferase SETMAR
MLEEELKSAIRSLRRGLLSKVFFLLHDNAWEQTSAATVTTIKNRKFQTIKHPPYSPDVAPSDCHMFGTLIGAFRGRKLHNND